jgi:hypothetical protein
VRRTTPRIQHRRSCSLLSHNHSSPRKREQLDMCNATAAINVRSVGHSPQTPSDVSVEFTRSAPHNDSHPASPMSLPAFTQLQQPTTTQATRRAECHPTAIAVQVLATDKRRANTIPLTLDIQRRQCGVYTQHTAQRLASSIAHAVVCSYTQSQRVTRHAQRSNRRHRAQLQQPTSAAQTQSHSLLASRDLSVEFTRSAPQSDSHPAALMVLPARTQSHSSHPRKAASSLRSYRHHRGTYTEHPATQASSCGAAPPTELDIPPLRSASCLPCRARRSSRGRNHRREKECKRPYHQRDSRPRRASGTSCSATARPPLAQLLHR